MAIMMCTIELKGAKFIVVYTSHCYYVMRPQDTQVQAVYISYLWQKIYGFLWKVSTVYVLVDSDSALECIVQYYNQTSPKWLPWGQRRLAVVERLWLWGGRRVI